LLKERGSKLASAADDVEVIGVDNKISTLIRSEGAAISKPICAFITFTNQEAKERALKYLTEKTSEGLKNEDYEGFVSIGCDLKVMDAPEPSDIIWENLQITPTVVKRMECLSWTIIASVLIGVFVLFTFMKLKAAENA
jgi:hypothetical protein